jgi:hypothetical protein
MLLHFHMVLFQLLNKIIFEALMSCELCSIEILYTGLALHHNLRAFSLDMLKQLRSRHVLELFLITDVTAELWALIHGMLLELSHGLPDNHAMLLIFVAFVRKFTEIYAVLKHLVDVLQKFSSRIAARAADVVPRCLQIRVCVLFKSNLAVFAEQFIAISAL